MASEQERSRNQQECGYCNETGLVYKLREQSRGAVNRCIECLAIEQGQQQFRLPFGAFVDEKNEDLAETSYENARDWNRILARVKDDEPIIKRDPDAIGTVNERIREFLTNVMGADAHKRPSELIDGESE